MNDIKQRLIPLETPTDVATALTEQADSIREKIEQLTDSLTAIEQLKTEVLQMRTVNFKKYADIIVNLQIKNDSYYLIKRFDDDMLDHIRNQFDRESGLDFMDRFNRLSDEIVQLQKENVLPESEKCQQIVKEYWGLIMEFTNGDMSMLPKLMEIGNIDTAANAWEERQKIVNDYLEPALQVYFSKLGVNPFEENLYLVLRLPYTSFHALLCLKYPRRTQLIVFFYCILHNFIYYYPLSSN